MAKWMRLFLSFLILIGTCMPLNVRASETDNIKDYLNYLSVEQLKNVQNSIDAIEDKYNLDVVIVVTDDTKGKTSRAFADDFYDYNGYGLDSVHSGLLMLINMKAREVWISTTGRAIDIYTDSRINTMINNITKYLSSSSYYAACKQFINDIETYASNGVPSNQYRVDENGIRTYNNDTNQSTYFDRAQNLMKSAFVYIIALMIALISTIIITVSNKGKVTINNQTYEEKGSFRLNNSTDVFLRKDMHRVIIQTDNNNGGGGSSTHTGSSGSSHGGGGGRF